MKKIISVLFVAFCAIKVEGADNDTNLGVIKGTNAEHCQFPHQVKVDFYGDGWGIGCGGSLVSPDTVVTAAHCFPKNYNYVRVRAGVLDISKQSEGEVRYGDKRRSMPHPEYRKSRKNDIGIIKLQSSFRLSRAIRPIRLCQRTPSGGTEAIASGWGAIDPSGNPGSDILQYVNVLTVTGRRCFGDSSEVCTSAPNGGGVCFGDSGGPLIIPGRNLCLLGVASAVARSCGNADGTVDFFSNVVENRDFVYRNM